MVFTALLLSLALSNNGQEPQYAALHFVSQKLNTTPYPDDCEHMSLIHANQLTQWTKGALSNDVVKASLVMLKLKESHHEK